MFYHKVRHKGREYTVEVVLSEELVGEGKIGLEVTGTVQDLVDEEQGSRKASEPQSVTLQLEANFEEKVVIVRHNDEVVGVIPLDVIDIGDIAEDAFGFPLSDAIENAASSAFEEIIERIPAVDPVLGCLLRSAASTAIGQTIRCWRKLREEVEGAWRLAREIALCLKAHGWQMAATFVFRAGRCILFGGGPAP